MKILQKFLRGYLIEEPYPKDPHRLLSEEQSGVRSLYVRSGHW